MNKSYDVYMCRNDKRTETERQLADAELLRSDNDFWGRKKVGAMPAFSSALFDSVLLAASTSYIRHKIKTRRSGS